eukprot:SAG31_NODE_234_length_19701_cov_16.835068_1_plen_188_part_00
MATAPKRARSSYTLFSKDKFSSLKPTGKSNPEIIKIIAAQWSALDINEKQRYARLAEEDRKRYDLQMQTYDGPPARNMTAKRKETLKLKKKTLKKKKKPKTAPMTQSMLVAALKSALEAEKKAKAQLKLAHQVVIAAKKACAGIEHLDVAAMTSTLNKSTTELTQLAADAIIKLNERGGSSFATSAL